MLGKLFPFPLRHFAYKKGTIGYNNILNKTLKRLWYKIIIFNIYKNYLSNRRKFGKKFKGKNENLLVDGLFFLLLYNITSENTFL